MSVINLYFNKKITGSKPKRACTSISKLLFDLYVLNCASEQEARKNIAVLLELNPVFESTISNFVCEHILNEIVKSELLKKYYLSRDQISLDLYGDSHKQTNLL